MSLALVVRATDEQEQDGLLGFLMESILATEAS